MTANGKGLWSGGAFETPLPERPPTYITVVQLLTNIQKRSVSPHKCTKELPMFN